MTTEKINQIIHKLESALPQDDTQTGACLVDVETVLDILEILDDLPFQLQMLDGLTKRCEQILEIGHNVRESDDKRKAYQEAAKILGWTDDRRTLENSKILLEYLDLIGVLVAAHLHSAEEIHELVKDETPLPKRMGKTEAIEFLSKKLQIQSYDATYQRLKRQKKQEIIKLKSENKDYSYLINILPPNYPQI